MRPLIRRLLFNMYQNQSIFVRWQDSFSDVFSMRNGVKQGAVLSLVPFTVNIDGLLQQLQTSGVGCHIGGAFTGGYDDAIVLFSPSVKALRYMICICEKFTEDYNIISNPARSKLLYYNVIHTYLIIELWGQPVNVII